MPDVYQFLADNGIAYQRFDHPAVFTCDEADRLCPEMPGSGTKNLFLRDKDGKRHFLVVVSKNKSADLKKLKELFGVSKLGFASQERLKNYLGVEPGSVTLLAVMNDFAVAVEVFIDAELEGKALQCHPLVNTATLVIEADGVQKFLALTKHAAKFIELPVRV